MTPKIDASYSIIADMRYFKADYKTEEILTKFHIVRPRTCLSESEIFKRILSIRHSNQMYLEYDLIFNLWAIGSIPMRQIDRYSYLVAFVVRVAHQVCQSESMLATRLSRSQSHVTPN